MAEPSPSRAHQKTEVIVISGFLGAGKTTLLKRILSWEGDLAETVVVVNEFGDVGIDGTLLKDAGSEVVELPGGCICCSMKTDLLMTLRRIRDRFNPKRLFIEATGVADPAAIVDAFRDKDLAPHMKIQRVVTVVEPEFWENHDNFGTFFFNQLKGADLILLNKIDRIEVQDIPRYLEEIHSTIPDSQVVPTRYCNVDPEVFRMDGATKDLGIRLDQFYALSHPSDANTATLGDQNPENGCPKQGNELHDHGVEKLGFVTFSFQDSRPINEDCFKEFTEALPWALFRMKGPVRFQDRTVMVNHAGGKSEWTEWDGTNETRLAFVGLNVNGDETILKLRNCINQP
jgi:G3E family GTPase